MKTASALAVAAALALPSVAAAQSLTPEEAQLLERIRSNPQKRAAAIAALGPVAATPAQKGKATKPVESANRPKPGEMETASNEPKPEKKMCEDQDWFFTLRQDWKDTGWLGCPSARATAHGAEASFTDDRVNQNKIWSINGTAAVSRVLLTEGEPWWRPYHKAFGAYVTMNRVKNSNTDSSKDNVDKLAYGLAAETGFNKNATFSAFFRLRGGGIENRLKNVTSSNVVFEIMPIVPIGGIFTTYAPIRKPGFPLEMSIEPTLIVQHNAATGKGQQLDFNGQNQALQVGAQVALFFAPSAFYRVTNKESPLNRWAADFTYRWTQETYTNRSMTWFGVGTTYNLDPYGFFALAFSYQRGNDQDTGTFTNLYKVGLTGKI